MKKDPGLQRLKLQDCLIRRCGALGFARLLFLAGFVGCSSATESLSIIPNSKTGRAAIEATVSTWKSGHQPGSIEPTTPRIQVVDNHRKPGQKVEGYEILGESADARVRTFTVRLSLAEPRESPVVRFLVVGIDPVLVFRQEDYELLMHWEHPMEKGADRDAPRLELPSK